MSMIRLSIACFVLLSLLDSLQVAAFSPFGLSRASLTRGSLKDILPWSGRHLRAARQITPLALSSYDPAETYGNQFDEYPMNPLDAYPSSATDEEILAELRIERQISNDRWQSTLFRDTQCGNWIGTYEVFLPFLVKSPSGDDDVTLRLVQAGSVATTMTSSIFDKKGVNITLSETYSPRESSSPKSSIPPPLPLTPVQEGLLLRQTRSNIASYEFRTSAGNQIVGNTYTIHEANPPVNSPESSASDGPLTYVGEVAVKEGLIRSRVRYAFSKEPTAALRPNEHSQYDLSLVGFVIIREALSNATNADTLPFMDEKLGPGIYDPQEGGEPYVQLNFPAKLSLLFPRGLSLSRRGVLTLEWEGSSMRYQVDRKFADLTGAIRTLELTEIRTQDVEKYPPPFVPVELLK